MLSLVVTMLIVAAGAGATALWGLKELRSPGPLSQSSNVVIEPGLRTHEIAELLEREGIVTHDWLFALAAHITRATRGSLKAGEYAFPPGASMAEVLDIIRKGRAVVHKVTVPEGWTSAQVVEAVNEHPALTGTIAEMPAEGSLLPDTYVFQRGATRQSLIARMQRAQQDLLAELWPQRASDLPIETKEEALILASIVEKETGLAGERRQVAAVFMNRLRQNMRLQSDPTIIYGIVGGDARLGRPISRSDIAEETPYNTYRINGLPPTPIANPGREAIAAVLQPDTTDDLYFVADGTGGHAFAETYDEHKKNVQRWRQIEAAREAGGADGDAAIQVSAEAEEMLVEDDEPVATLDSAEPIGSETVEADAAAPAEANAGPASEAGTSAADENDSGGKPDLAEAAAPDSSHGSAADDQPPEVTAERQTAAAGQPEPQQPEPSASPAPSDIPLPRPKPQRN